MSQQKYSLLYPDTNAQYRTLSDVTMHDLGMDQICKKLSAKEREQNYIQNVMARLYADPAVTQYRCDIFEDVLQQKKMRDDLMEILERISFLREYGSFNREYDESACIWDLLHRLDELNDYIKCVDALHTCLAASDIHSAGFLGLKAYVEKIYADNGFAELKKDISELKMDTSQLKSITVGINLNDRFEADGIGLISVNSKYFTKSGILGNFYDHITSKDRINEDTIWKKNFKFQPFDVNADAVISTPMQKVMDTAVMRSESRGGIVKLPEGDQRSGRESAATLRTKCYRHKNKNGFPVYFAFRICCFSHRISPIICISPYTDFVINLTHYCQKLQYLTSYLLHSATGHSSYPGVPQRVRSVYHKHK